MNRAPRHTLFSILSVGLFCWALWGNPMPTMAGGKNTKKKAKAVSKATASIAWNGVLQQYQTNFWLAGQLLAHQASQPFNVPASQLKIQWNAGSILRLTKAYDFYLKGLSGHFPGQSAHWKKMRKWNRKLGIVAGMIRKDALKGEKGKVWGSALKKLAKGYKLGKIPTSTKAVHPKRFKYLLEAISGIGTGSEILSYYRLQQVKAGLSKKKKVSKKDLAPLGALLGHFRSSKGLFLRLRKQLPGAKWLGLYGYHAALLYRCGLLYGKSLRSKAAKQKALQARYKKRSAQLRKSLKKANSSFKKFWRL